MLSLTFISFAHKFKGQSEVLCEVASKVLSEVASEGYVKLLAKCYAKLLANREIGNNHYYWFINK